MKIRSLLLILGLSVIPIYGQTATPIYFTVANRYDQVIVPAGPTLTGQYGCTGAWTAVTLAPGSYPVYAGGLPGVTKDPTTCTGQPVLQILEVANALSVVDITSVYSAAGVLTSTSTPVVIPSSTPVVPPPPPNTYPIPTSGSKACTVAWTVGTTVVPPATVPPLVFTFTCP